MSLSLLNDYDSSDESGGEDHESPAETSTTGELDEKKLIEGKNFFIASSDSEVSGSGDSDDDDEGNWTKANQNSSAIPLPRPFDNTIIAGSDTSSVSVFRNPFLEAERAETFLLEQHVKLSETAYTNRLNDERERAKHKFRKSSLPCRQFKRGKCRMGDKCRFLHAAFPTAAPGGLPASSTPSTSEITAAPSVYGGKAVRYTEWGKEEIIGDGDDDAEGKKAKKRRVGITNSLVPPKRALANYEKQRRDEAPWLNK